MPVVSEEQEDAAAAGGAAQLRTATTCVQSSVDPTSTSWLILCSAAVHRPGVHPFEPASTIPAWDSSPLRLAQVV
jgi:hypothetical protein